MYLECACGLQAFDDTRSLGSPPPRVVYSDGSMVSPWMTASHFIAENREAELKSTTFSIPSFQCFPVFPLLLTLQQYSTFECCLLVLLNDNNDDDDDDD